MVDITHKKESLRIATASAFVRCSKTSIEAIHNKTVPKGDVLEMAKTAGLFAVKRTSDMIPDCHPLPVESTSIKYDIQANGVEIIITVKAIYRTGLEVEAMHGASVVALTMYDMLKPIDKGIEITNIKLIEKSGGKSDLKAQLPKNLTASILSISDMIHNGKKINKGETIVKSLLEMNSVNVLNIHVLPSSIKPVQSMISKWVSNKINLIITTGGTGLSEVDKTPDFIQPMFDKELPAVTNLLMNYGFDRTFKSLISRPVAGLIGDTVVISIPGSAKGAKESMEALLPEILYLFKSIHHKG